jgi:dienelactone hydrolase
MNPRHLGSLWRACSLLVLAAALAGCGTSASRPAAETSKPPVIKDEMRMPWTPAGPPFIRNWLVLGAFPFQPAEAGAGLDTDYLKDAGGEAAARPVAGQAVKRPDGTPAPWTAVKSSKDIVDFVEAFKGQPAENVIGYAYTTVQWPKDEPALMAVGSDDGVAVWLNGRRVHRNAVMRGIAPDSDPVPVNLKAGENRILVKVEQGGGGWCFCLRLLPADQVVAVVGEDLTPEVPAADPAAPTTLSVRTDRTSANPAGTAPVKVEVIAAGGRPVAEKDGPRGATVAFDTSAWPDGPYDIRCTTQTSLGKRRVAHLPWFKGNWQATARRLADSATKADPAAPDGLVRAMLAQWVRDRLGADLEHPKGGWPSIHSALMEAAELDLARDGAPGGARPYGFVRLAWMDETDHSPQFCRAYLPADYDPARTWPMVVSLHGYKPENPPYIASEDVDRRHSAWADRYNVIVLEPYGRGNSGYEGFGEADVLRAVDQAKRKLAVDGARTYLMGYSMGGGGTWTIGTHHPEIFAALAPIFGGWDWHADTSDAAAAALTPWQRFTRERWSSYAQAEALLATPVFVVHGDADDTVSVENSRYIVKMLQRWGYDVRYWEHPGKGHGQTPCEDVVLPWLLEHTLAAAPTRVRLRAANLATASAHWVRVTQCASPRQMIVAEAEIVDPNTIRLDTENALEVVLNMSLDERLRKPVTILWNGKTFKGEEDPAYSLKHRFVLRADDYQRQPGDKTPELCGPISAAAQTPFAIVMGTTGKDPLMRRLCEKQALAAVRAWEAWQHQKPRFFKDTEIGDADLKAYSLILIGGPEANAVTRRLADPLRLSIAEDAITIDGRKFPARDAAVAVVRPHPLNPERYVVVRAGQSAKGMFWADPLPDDVDFVIADGRVADAKAGRPPEKVRIASGDFDRRWRIREALTDLGDPKVRAAGPDRKVPAHASANVKGDRLSLSDLLETATEGSFEDLRRDVNVQFQPLKLGGKTFEKGLAVRIFREASGADYDLAGAGWKRLRGTVGLEIAEPAKLEPRHKDNTRVVFTVKGDGKVLFRSNPMRWDSPPAALDVDLSGVKVLRLEAANESMWNFWWPTSLNWADVRLER